MLKTATQNLDALIRESHAEVTYDPLPTLSCPQVLVLQLFQNLISNAVKYRDDARPPRVHVSVEISGPEYVFAVSDNGIGIEPEYTEYVFGVFKRLDRNIGDGAGIGLAICRAAVARLGGRIWAESEVGQGSTFRFTVPREGGQHDAGQ
ncbi:MAG: ATP-binding protein [Acidobacteria bacterium]|nr:ATP-binding protein [Acidobacteriota bacterium]